MTFFLVYFHFSSRLVKHKLSYVPKDICTIFDIIMIDCEIVQYNFESSSELRRMTYQVLTTVMRLETRCKRLLQTLDDKATNIFLSKASNSFVK